MKVKLFTHTDLDGIGCAILGKLVFEDIDIEFCNYDDVNEKVSNLIINNLDVKYDKIFITDISVNELVAELINNLNPLRITLLDHHPTAEWLNKYEWAKVEMNNNEALGLNQKQSGTMMFCKYLHHNPLGLPYDNNLFNFSEIIRRYDTWEWKTKYNDNNPKLLNDLLFIKGREDFINDMVNRLKDGNYFDWSEIDLTLLNYKQKEIDKYVESKNKQIIRKDILGYKAGIVFAEQYHSELGNKLSELNQDLDFIVLINPSQSVSYRTIKEIDLGKDIAKVYGGGGHPKAAGSPISDEIKNKIIDLIFGC